MNDLKKKNVGIVDYGLGNLFSIKHACASAGMTAEITSSKIKLLRADAVILPGVGAFGDAMNALRRLDLIETIKDIGESDKPLIGICLGMQLLFTESNEFGLFKGLDLIEGEVVKFDKFREPNVKLKVPQICWNRIYSVDENGFEKTGKHSPSNWHNTLLEKIENGSFMYFVHSYYCIPSDSSVDLTRTIYGTTTYCSALKKKNVYGFQFHPERSGTTGLKIYKELNKLVGGIG